MSTNFVSFNLRNFRKIFISDAHKRLLLTQRLSYNLSVSSFPPLTSILLDILTMARRRSNRGRRNPNRSMRGTGPANDSTTLRGRFRLPLTDLVSGAGVTAIALNPLEFGDRALAVGAAFLRYRFNWVRFKFRSNVSPTGDIISGSSLGTTGSYAMGVSDDTDETSTTLTTADQVLNLRCSLENSAWKDGTILWRPVDRSKVYYVNGENTVGDARFTLAGIFTWLTDQPINIAGSATSPGIIEVEYSITFSGATTVAI